MSTETSELFREVAPSQHEIDMRYTDALRMADNVMTYRLIVKEVALKNEVYATFMPKPIFGENGSGMHTHMSLFKGDKNAFFDPDGECYLSKEAMQFISGLLTHSREITLVTNHQCAEESEVVRKALGDNLFEKLIADKKIAWDEYRAQVTNYELDRYLSIL